MRTLQATTDIDAPVGRVWDIISNVAAYPEWNPFIRKVEGVLEPGTRLTMRIEPPGGGGVNFKPTVQVVQPNHLVRWLGRLLVPGLFDGEHSLQLQALDNNHTRFTQSERFTGLLVPLFGGLLNRTQQGFVEMNQALKTRAENV